MLRMSIGTLRARAEQSSNILIAVAFGLAGFMPIILSGQANAATLTSRKITVSTSQVSAVASHTFDFNVPANSTLGSIQILYCTTPLGVCTAPTGLSASAATVGVTTPAGFTVDATTANSVRLTNTPAPILANAPVSIPLGNITNPSSPNTSFYPRITTYSDAAYTTVVDNGAVAASTGALLTVNGRVQERLVFCVAAITDVAALPTDCSVAPAATTIDIGVIDNVNISKAPVDISATNGANDSYGIAQVNTNAASGIVVSYFPEAAATGTNDLRAFRVPGASCTGNPSTSLVDQCFVNAAAGGETFVVDGTDQERFGLFVPCVDNTQGTTTNLGSVPGAYDGSDNTAAIAPDCENEANTDFAWNNSNVATTLATSSSVVDDEIVKLSFGALAQATTPTGSYTVATTYIATPTF